MRRILLFLLALNLLQSCKTIQLDPPERCDAELVDALSKETEIERLGALQIRVERCPQHVPTLVAAAELYCKMTDDADPEWLSITLQYLKTSVDSMPDNGDARWWLGSALQYAGRYDLAIKQYEWIIGSGIQGGIDEAMVQESRIRSITCEFMLLNSQVSTNIANKDSVDVSDVAIRLNSNWLFLKRPIAAVAFLLDIAPNDDGDAYVQTALGLLEDWNHSPKRYSVEMRNKHLDGIVSGLARLVFDNNLTDKLTDFKFETPSGLIRGLPNTGYAVDAEKELTTGGSKIERMFIISKGLEIEEKWFFSDLSGTYQCVEGKDIKLFNIDKRVAEPSMLTPSFILSPLRIRHEGSRLFVSGELKEEDAAPARNDYVTLEVMRKSPESWTTTLAGVGELVGNQASVVLNLVTRYSGTVTWKENKSMPTNSRTVPSSEHTSQEKCILVFTRNGEFQIKREGSTDKPSTWRR